MKKFATKSQAVKYTQQMACAGVAFHLHQTAKGWLVEYDLAEPANEAGTHRRNELGPLATPLPVRHRAVDLNWGDMNHTQRQLVLDASIMSFRRSVQAIDLSAIEQTDLDTTRLHPGDIAMFQAKGVYPEGSLTAARQRAKALLRKAYTVIEGKGMKPTPIKLTLAAHPRRKGWDGKGQEVWVFHQRPRHTESIIETWEIHPGWVLLNGERWFNTQQEKIMVCLDRRLVKDANERTPFKVTQAGVPATVPYWAVEVRDPLGGESYTLTIRSMSSAGARRKTEAAKPGWPITDVVEVTAEFATREDWAGTASDACAYDGAGSEQDLAERLLGVEEEQVPIVELEGLPAPCVHLVAETDEILDGPLLLTDEQLDAANAWHDRKHTQGRRLPPRNGAVAAEMSGLEIPTPPVNTSEITRAIDDLATAYYTVPKVAALPDPPGWTRADELRHQRRMVELGIVKAHRKAATRTISRI